MNITIHERDKWRTLEYEISTPSGSLLAKSLPSFFQHKLEISSQGAVVAHLEEESTILHSRFRFVFQDGRTYSFEHQKTWSPIYKCTGNGESYTFQQHSQSKLSIFKDDLPVATIARPFSFLKGLEYTLTLEENTDPLLAVCMVLAARALERAAELSAVLTS